LVEIQRGDRDPSKPKVTGKITDFGLSWIIGETSNDEKVRYSEAMRWQAPELSNENLDAENREKIMEKADVWSFAMTSLEVSVSLYHLFSVSTSK
jgi:serine/threonine protein kinase